MQALQREREQLEAQLREEQAQAQAPAYPAAPSQPPPPPAAGGTADDDDADDPQFAAELLAAIQASAAAAPPPATTVLPPTVDMTQVPTEAELEGYIEGNVLGAGGQGSLTIGYTRDRRKAFVIKKIPCRYPPAPHHHPCTHCACTMVVVPSPQRRHALFHPPAMWGGGGVPFTTRGFVMSNLCGWPAPI